MYSGSELAVAALPIAIAAFWGEISAAQTRLTVETSQYLAATLTSDPEPPPGVDLETYRRDMAERTARLRAELVARVEAEPGVDDVAMARAMPGDEPAARIDVEGDVTGVTVRFNEVSSDFFTAFGTPVLAGRLLAAGDSGSAGYPIVVNHAFVRQVLGNRDAIGRRIRYTASREEGLALGEKPETPTTAAVETGRWHEIVGVAGDLYTNPIDPELVRPAVFHALGTASDLRPALFIKVRGRDARDFSARLRDITTSLDPAARLNVWPFAEMERQQQLALRLLLLVLSLITIAVLLLSAAGIYALMSFTVSRRRKEIGIRAAMGADSAQLLRGIFARSAAQLGLGVTIGGGLALLADIISGGEALGPTGRLFVPAIAVIMIVVGLLASIGPARRGLRVQPTEALRAE